MPNFVTTAGEEVYRDSVRPVFRRGKRLDETTIRRVRDILIAMLSSLGMSSEDIGQLTQQSVTSRQVRNRIHRDVPTDFRESMEQIAVEIIASAKRRVAAMKPPRHRAARATRRASSRQLSLPFGDE